MHVLREGNTLNRRAAESELAYRIEFPGPDDTLRYRKITLDIW